MDVKYSIGQGNYCELVKWENDTEEVVKVSGTEINKLKNGSGKSTVTSIVAGMQPCDSGKMFFKGQEWKPQSMIDALHRGIGMIVQESGTIQGVTVAENIFLAETEKYKNKFGLVNRKK